MTVLAVVIGDYCSEYMPWWYCSLFSVPVSLVILAAVLSLVTVMTVRRSA